MIGRKGLRGRFSFWVGPVSFSFLKWGQWYRGGRVLVTPWLRVQVGGNQPWRGTR